MAKEAVVTQQQWSPIISEMSSSYGIEPGKLIETIKKTVFPSGGASATNEQLLAFLTVANKYGLNPFTREIYAFTQNGGIVPIVSIDGRVTLTQREKEYDGCEFIDHREDGVLVAVTCRMFRKDRTHPTEVTEYMVECKRNTDPWNKMPSRMLRHKAFIQASRYAFGFSGLYDEDEARDIVDAEVIPGKLEIEPVQGVLTSTVTVPSWTDTVMTGTVTTDPTAQPKNGEGVYFLVGKLITEIRGTKLRRVFSSGEMSPLGLKIEGTAWTIPAANTDDFLQLCHKRGVKAQQIDSNGVVIADSPYEQQAEPGEQNSIPALFEDGQ